MRPYLDTVFSAFPNRIMFGSDWPVCNVGGPKGETGNWSFWVEIVAATLEDRGLSVGEKESVWYRAGCSGYEVEL
jgi:predicted TIM-barrel fold metal-dependent hydrolase